MKTGQCTGSLSADALDCKSTCMLVVLKTLLTSVKMIRSHILGRECGLLPYKGPCSTVHCSTKPCAPPFIPCARLTDPVMGLSAVPESYLTKQLHSHPQGVISLSWGGPGQCAAGDTYPFQPRPLREPTLHTRALPRGSVSLMLRWILWHHLSKPSTW